MSIVSNIIYAIAGIHCSLQVTQSVVALRVCPNQNGFDTMLQFNGLARLPSYLQQSCYIYNAQNKFAFKC